MRNLLICLTVLALAACSYPVETTRVVDEHPAILVQGAPAGAMLSVDGLVAGRVTDAGGAPQAIRVEPGTHVIAVGSNGMTLLRERVFVDDGIVKTITIPASTVKP